MPNATLWLLNGNCVCDDALAFFVQRLSSSEANHYDSFLRRERQRQFLLGRTLLRFAVSNLTGCRLMGSMSSNGPEERRYLYCLIRNMRVPTSACLTVVTGWLVWSVAMSLLA